MRWHWVPWKYVLRRVARSQGFLDPVRVLSQLENFAQPSEVAAPLELIRAGVVFHTRGLLNTKAIQSNLDWVWPYWVRRQFDPSDPAFLPRAFSITHVNLTNRNWTAVGLPDCAAYPVVDPRGLVTPLFDGWSLDGWILSDEGENLIPSRLDATRQRLDFDERRLAVETETEKEGLRVTSRVDMTIRGDRPFCRIRYRAEADRKSCFAVALRPFNPEGVSFVHQIAVAPGYRHWSIDERNECVAFETSMDRHLASTYAEGDVFLDFLRRDNRRRAECKVGMATAAAVYDLRPHEPLNLTVWVALSEQPADPEVFPASRRSDDWAPELRGLCRMRLPDKRIEFLYNAALRSLILHSPLDVFPGPYTYKRFWFRDAVMILHPMLCVGLHDRADRAIDRFASRQNVSGFFHSQEGEWDSNGQVLWLYKRFCELTGRPCKPEWLSAALRGGRWIRRKRLPADTGQLHAGLLPAGFSAEHLGNNDFYYWDDYWALAGLHAAARLALEAGDKASARELAEEAKSLLAAIDRSLERSASIRRRDAIPASPHRRMDAGAVGSIVAGYPLQLLDPKEPRLLSTVQFLLDNCFYAGAFFQDMIHSGMNMYLSLHCAQTLLRAGDSRFWPIVERVAELASPTGQWPEAIHPRTLGGCMGDGQHVWAAAEWVMMMRNLFLREEGDALILQQGIPDKWLRAGEAIEFGPAHTAFGAVTVRLLPQEGGVAVRWEAAWRKGQPPILVAPPGREPLRVDDPERREVKLTL